MAKELGQPVAANSTPALWAAVKSKGAATPWLLRPVCGHPGHLHVVAADKGSRLDAGTAHSCKPSPQELQCLRLVALLLESNEQASPVDLATLSSAGSSSSSSSSMLTLCHLTSSKRPPMG